MTEIQLVKYQLFMMKKLAKEAQGALHFLAQAQFKDRHISDYMANCTEPSCVQFNQTMRDIDKLPEDYNKSFKLEEVKNQETTKE